MICEFEGDPTGLVTPDECGCLACADLLDKPTIVSPDEDRHMEDGCGCARITASCGCVVWRCRTSMLRRGSRVRVCRRGFGCRVGVWDYEDGE